MWFLAAAKVTVIAVPDEIPERGVSVIIETDDPVVSIAPVKLDAWVPVRVTLVLTPCPQMNFLGTVTTTWSAVVRERSVRVKVKVKSVS